MNTFFKNKLVTVLILVATIILAGVAIFTAIRLYQLRQEAVAPTAPESKPRAAAVPEACGSLVFTLTAISSPSPSASATASPTSTPTQGEPNSCGGTCGSDSNCKSGLTCYQGFCRNPSCSSDTDCNCPAGGGSTATAKPTAKATATPTEAPSLPESGTGWPTVIGVGVGAILIIGAILLAL